MIFFKSKFTGYSASLPWSTRMKIAHGAATGLQFLHEAENPVIYRDFKASNILLDSVSNKFHFITSEFQSLFKSSNLKLFFFFFDQKSQIVLFSGLHS